MHILPAAQVSRLRFSRSCISHCQLHRRLPTGITYYRCSP